MNLQPGKRIAASAFVAAALILVPAAVSQTRPPYGDASGDSGSAGDIAGVTVLGDKANGQLLFGISGTNLSTSPSQLTLLAIDSDANPATGNAAWDGADYGFIVDDSSYDFVHWNGSEWVETPYSTVDVRSANAGKMLTISVNRRELGNTSDFNFLGRTLDTGTKATDDAPDDGMYNYSLDAGGPDIKGITVQTAPSYGPKAGKPFVVTAIGLTLPPNGAIAPVLPHPDRYSCRAKLNGHAIAGTGTGGCTFRIGKKKRGKRLTVVVTAAYEGATKSVPFTFVVS